MQSLPSRAELLTAVREFLTSVAVPELSGRSAFHARVAANVLGIVQRELELGASADEGEHRRLRALLDRDGRVDELNDELCHRIRSGELSADDPALIDHLWSTTLDRLSIDQPNYAAYKKAIGSEDAT